MREWHNRTRKNMLAKRPEVPYGYKDHSALANPTCEMVWVNPTEFLRLERLGKRKRKPITLPRVSILP